MQQQSDQKEQLALKQGPNDTFSQYQLTQPTKPPSTTSWTKDKKVMYSIYKDASTNLPAKRVSPAHQTASPSDRANENPISIFKPQNGSGHRQRRDDTLDRSSTNSTSDYSNIDQQTNNPQQQQQQPANQATSASNSASTIIGHYHLKRTLGKGNFSTVKLAQHRITQHSVAIKIVKISILSDDNLMKINREIEVLKKLGKHDHIVRLYQVIKTKRYFMLVTEFCPNGELYDYLVDKGKLSESQACNYFLQILSAVEYLHGHNIVHRDLKAENLLLAEENKTIKIADFGFANYYKHDKPLSTWCGSPPYAAPELFKGLQYVGPPVDIWSMGVILYVMVCGSLPFDGHNLVYLKSRVLSGKYRIPFFMSTECEGLIRGMLRLDPERRFNIRQIEANSWIMKYNGPVTKRDIPSGSVGQTVFMGSTNTSTSNANSSKMSIVSSDADSVNHSDKNNKKSNGSRGHSLDSDDDKKRALGSIEDSPMPCASDEKYSSKISHRDMGSSVKNPKIQNFVDTEIANAVSNMSLDSNNSSMSVSQSFQTLSSSSAGGGQNVSNPRAPETIRAPKRNSINKENSIDDQIIDYMVENLKVAESQNPIRQSIANDRYDDLHAIYKLIRDQPGSDFEAHRSAKFKVPSLPLISLNKQQSTKKPSITTGFFNVHPAAISPDSSGNLSRPFDNASPKESPKNSADGSQTQYSDMNEEQTSVDGSVLHRNDAIDLTNNHIQKSQPARQPDDQSWIFPPQLFLTPPAENRVQDCGESANREVEVETPKTCTDAVTSPTIPEVFNAESCKPNVDRHSFDSTLQQLCDISGAILASSNNKLALSNTAKHCLWDSSILDNLSVSSPPRQGEYQVNIGNQILPNSGVTSQGNSISSGAQHLAQNLVGITTNLPQIGVQSNAFQNTLNQNLYLAQLNSLALSAAVTQSSMLNQGNPGDQRYQGTIPIKFTPNNLMNQNFNAMNSFALQNTLNNPCAPNLSLLDPNGLVSGFERRASDGQASYSSLTNNTDLKSLEVESQNYELNRLSSNLNFQPCSTSTVPTTFLSSSSNQIASDSSRFKRVPNFCSFDANSNINPQACLPSDNYNRSRTSEESMIVSNESNQIVSPQRLEGIAQTNPLDLTKCSNDNRNREMEDQSSENRAMFDQRQQRIGRTTGQRSNSTTSDSLVFQPPIQQPVSATTSPRNSLFISSAFNNSAQYPSYQISPSSSNLTGGGPGHLLNRRKRHSLDTETRHQHQRHLSSQQTGNHHQHHGPGLHFLKKYNDSNRSLRQNSNQQYLQYPLHSHVGQLRNFAQTFTYKKSMKKQANPQTSWQEAKDSQSIDSQAIPNIADLGNLNNVMPTDCVDERSRQ